MSPLWLSRGIPRKSAGRHGKQKTARARQDTSAASIPLRIANATAKPARWTVILPRPLGLGLSLIHI